MKKLLVIVFCVARSAFLEEVCAAPAKTVFDYFCSFFICPEKVSVNGHVLLKPIEAKLNISMNLLGHQRSPKNDTRTSTTETPANGVTSNEIIVKPISLLESFGGAVIMALIICAILYCREIYNRRKNSFTVSDYYGGRRIGEIRENPQPNVRPPMVFRTNSNWQLHPQHLEVNEMLGQGVFGVVHKGFLRVNGKGEVVAIKMLKGSPDAAEIKSFTKEIDIMKSVGSHPHLVSLKGYCWKTVFGRCLVIEYCAKGDLQAYLRAVRKRILAQTPKTSYVALEHIDDTKQASEVSEFPLLRPKELLSFAHQIILGMEHLSNGRIVHRDLAARNVLMCEDGTLKVADFGLSRDVYLDGVYSKSGSGLIPVKWVALEALAHRQYSTKGDVWSFGILLWEIVTLGGYPYPTIPEQGLLQLLETGYRMERPKKCSPELYEIMSSCWRALPEERPTFGDLRLKIEELMGAECDHITVDTEQR